MASSARTTRRSVGTGSAIPTYQEVGSDEDEYETIAMWNGGSRRQRKRWDIGWRIVHPPKSKYKKRKTKASRRSSGLTTAALEGLFQRLPLDVLQIIFSSLGLVDLISLLRTAKPIRQMLLTRSISKVVWRRAFQPLWDHGLPKPPKTLSLPQYASILTISECSLCAGKLVSGWRSAPCFCSGVALCYKCNVNELVHLDSKVGRETWPSQDPRLQYILKPVLYGDNHWTSGAFFRADIDDAVAYLAELDPNDDDDAMETFNATYADVKLSIQHGKALNADVAAWRRQINWQARIDKRNAREVAYDARHDFAISVFIRLTELKWTDGEVDYVGDRNYGYKSLPTKKLDENGWTKLHRKLESMRGDYQAAEKALRRKRRITNRIWAIRSARRRAGGQWPPLFQLLRRPEFRAFVEEEPDDSLEEYYDSDRDENEFAGSGLLRDATLYERWRADAIGRLASSMRAATGTDQDIGDADLLSRVGSLFICSGCQHRCHVENALAHCCTEFETDGYTRRFPSVDEVDPIDMLRPIDDDEREGIARGLVALGPGAEELMSATEELPEARTIIISPSFRPDLAGSDHPVLRLAGSFNKMVEAARRSGLDDAVDHLRFAFRMKPFCTPDAIELGQCCADDHRIGPIRELERHAGIAHGIFHRSGGDNDDTIRSLWIEPSAMIDDALSDLSPVPSDDET